jgi:hypothetical protein
MASLCRRPQSKLHFLDCAEKLGQEASPPINQVFLAVFVAGEILSANEALFDLTYHQEKSGASHDYDYRLRVLKSCERICLGKLVLTSVWWLQEAPSVHSQRT